MSNEWRVPDSIKVQEISLEQVPETAKSILTGKHIGRTLVRPGELKS